MVGRRMVGWLRFELVLKIATASGFNEILCGKVYDRFGFSRSEVKAQSSIFTTRSAAGGLLYALRSLRRGPLRPRAPWI